MNRIIVIGVSGKKNAGKDTFADIVKEVAQARGFQVRSRTPGDRVREELAVMLAGEFGQSDAHSALTWVERHEMVTEWMRVNGPTKEQFRPLQQWWGWFRRQYFDDSYFEADLQAYADSLQPLAPKVVLLQPSVRFISEADQIHSLGGIVVRVEASYPGFKADDTHLSETALDDYTGFDAKIHNNSTVERFAERVRHLAGCFLDALPSH